MNDRIRILFNIFAVPAASVFSLVALVFIFSQTPVRTLYFFFAGPFFNIYNFGNMLNASVPLIIGALGIIIAMKAGSLNLGGEGQVYLGAFVSTITAIYLSGSASWLPAVFITVIAITAGSFFSGAAAAFSGFCKAKWKTNELITSFLLSCALIPVINFFVTGPFMDPQTSLL
jgi:simple sugar transport system permease protein